MWLGDMDWAVGLVSVFMYCILGNSGIKIRMVDFGKNRESSLETLM